MLLILYIFVIVFLLIFRKKTKNSWLIAASIIVLLSITTSNYADLTNYEPLFNYYNMDGVIISSSTNNFIWALLCKLFYSIGFNYRGMVVCLILINYFILHKAALNMKCNENKFFGLFLIFPSVIQLVQLKFFTAFVIVVLAYSIFILEKKGSFITYILMVLFASLIHSSSMLFLILCLSKKDKLNKNVIFIISFILAIILSFNINFISEFSKAFISMNQYERYIVNTITPSSFLWILLIFISWLICYVFATIVNHYINKNCNYENLIFKREIISIILLLLTLPLLLLDRNMHRFLEIGFIILYFMISSQKIKYKNSLDLILCLCICLIGVMFIYTPYSTVLNPLFSYETIVNIWR